MTYCLRCHPSRLPGRADGAHFQAWKWPTHEMRLRVCRVVRYHSLSLPT